MQIYVGFVALIANLVVAALVTLVLRQMRVFNGTDETNATITMRTRASPASGR